METELNKKLNVSNEKYKVLDLVVPSGELDKLRTAIACASRDEPGAGLFLVSTDANVSNANRLAVVVKSGLDLSALDWFTYVASNLTEKVETHMHYDMVCLEIVNNPQAGKIKDQMMSHAINFLRQKCLISAAAEEDDYIDPELYGLGCW